MEISWTGTLAALEKNRASGRRMSSVDFVAGSRSDSFALFLQGFGPDMKRFERKRIIVGWVLLLTFMAFFAVKTVHRHPSGERRVCENRTGGSSQPAEENCPVCQFTLSPFVQAEPLQVDSVQVFSIRETVSCSENPCIGISCSISLRGPPAFPA